MTSCKRTKRTDFASSLDQFSPLGQMLLARSSSLPSVPTTPLGDGVEKRARIGGPSRTTGQRRCDSPAPLPKALNARDLRQRKVGKSTHLTNRAIAYLGTLCGTKSRYRDAPLKASPSLIRKHSAEDCCCLARSGGRDVWSIYFDRDALTSLALTTDVTGRNIPSLTPSTDWIFVAALDNSKFDPLWDTVDFRYAVRQASS